MAISWNQILNYDFTKVSYDSLWMPYYWWMADPVNEPYYPVKEEEGNKIIYPKEYYSRDDIYQDEEGLHFLTRLNPKTFIYKDNPFTILYSTGLLSSMPIDIGDARSVMISVEAKLPPSGFWSALWLYGDTSHPAEIDFMEQLSSGKSTFSTNVHTESANCVGKYHRRQNLEDFDSSPLIPDLNKEFCTYTCTIHLGEKIEFLFNGNLIRTVRSRINTVKFPMHIIMNNAIRNALEASIDKVVGDLTVRRLTLETN